MKILVAGSILVIALAGPALPQEANQPLEVVVACGKIVGNGCTADEVTSICNKIIGNGHACTAEQLASIKIIGNGDKVAAKIIGNGMTVCSELSNCVASLNP